MSGGRSLLHRNKPVWLENSFILVFIDFFWLFIHFSTIYCFPFPSPRAQMRWVFKVRGKNAYTMCIEENRCVVILGRARMISLRFLQVYTSIFTLSLESDGNQNTKFRAIYTPYYPVLYRIWSCATLFTYSLYVDKDIGHLSHALAIKRGRDHDNSS